MTPDQGPQTVQQQQQTPQTQTQTMHPATAGGEPTLQPPGLVPTGGSAGSLAINLENDLFLIGNSVIALLGNVNTLQFENGLNEEVTIRIVIGYPVDRPSI
jgi:hypothetical protein